MTVSGESPLIYPYSSDRVIYIDRECSKLIIHQSTDIRQCAGLLKTSPAIIVVNDRQELMGTITNGDIRRMVERGEQYRSGITTAGDVCFKSPTFAHINDSIETITHHLASYIKLLPLVDSTKVVRGVAYIDYPHFNIAEHSIRQGGNEVYTIAEIGVNHNGSVKTAKELIMSAIDAGFSAVKFQVRSRDYFTTTDFNTLDLGSQYLKKEIERTYLSHAEIRELIHFAKDNDINVICTPFDLSSLKFCLREPIDGLKIASCDLTNTPLLKAAAMSPLPLIVSTGMSWEREIVNAYRLIALYTTNFSLLHCNSTYPCPPHDVNLRYLERLKTLTPCVIGYSSHDSDPLVCALAVAKGARVLEVHITQDRTQNGTDHKASIDIADLRKVIDMMKDTITFLGSDCPRTPSQGEMLNRLSLGKSLCTTRNLKKGAKLRHSDLELRSPGNGFGYDKISKLVGAEVRRDIKKGEMIKNSDVGIIDTDISIRQLHCAIETLEGNGLIAGIPVRYHDFQFLSSDIPVRFVEFHMSDSDLQLDPTTRLPSLIPYEYLYVHAVEQYSDGFILDLATEDKAHLEESTKRFRKLIKHCSHLTEHYHTLKNCSVIVNIGGFSSRRFISERQYKELHSRAISNLIKLKKLAEREGIDILLQTMPSIPWHQGGVAYHHLMVTPESIRTLACETELKICLDISHSFLAASDRGLDFEEFVDDIIKFVAYLHVSDASHLSQEGLQISEGNIDLKRILSRILDVSKPLCFIPEVWNGHQNNGEGFKIALMRLSDLFSNSA